MPGKSYFLCKIDGIDGESPDPRYAGYFEIDNWGWDAYMQATQQTGAGMVMGKATLGTFSFDKVCDKATPKLVEAVAKGQHIGQAVCIARKQGRASAELEEFAKYTFRNIVISGYNIHGIGEGGGLPGERIDVSFEFLKMECDKKNADGSSAGWQAAEFNSKTNQAA
jgi:type VI secretion system secreted protein Hcp